jgi:mycothiol synthase
MDQRAYSIRPYGDSDCEAQVRVMAVIEPGRHDSADDIRQHDAPQGSAPERFRLKLVVEEVRSGSVIAWGYLGHGILDYHPTKYWMFVGVHPDHQGRGIGIELCTRLEKTAQERGGTCIWSNAREAIPQDIKFMERRGFVPLRKEWLSRLDLNGFNPSKFSPHSKALNLDGIHFSTLAEEGTDQPAVLRRIYRLIRTTEGDAPQMGAYTPMTFEEFTDSYVRGSKVLTDATFLARIGQEYLGWSSLERAPGQPNTLTIAFTGTLPNYRNRGIASELKRRTIEYAIAHGYRYVITGNDSLNARIWASTRSWGFVRNAYGFWARRP